MAGPAGRDLCTASARTASRAHLIVLNAGSLEETELRTVMMKDRRSRGRGVRAYGSAKQRARTSCAPHAGLEGTVVPFMATRSAACPRNDTGVLGGSCAPLRPAQAQMDAWCAEDEALQRPRDQYCWAWNEDESLEELEATLQNGLRQEVLAALALAGPSTSAGSRIAAKRFTFSLRADGESHACV